MAARKKKRTSIRTAAGTAQERFLERLRALRDDPTRVLPEVIGPEPKPLAKVRAGIEKAATGRPGFAAKRDKGVVGAVVQSMPLAELEAVPRLVDHKVGGRRRFYLMRGQAARRAMRGVLQPGRNLSAESCLARHTCVSCSPGTTSTSHVLPSSACTTPRTCWRYSAYFSPLCFVVIWPCGTWAWPAPSSC